MPVLANRSAGNYEDSRPSLERASGLLATQSELGFLAHLGVEGRLLGEAVERSARHGTQPLEELISLGFGRRRYWSLLARHLGLRFLTDLSGAELLNDSGKLADDALRSTTSVLVRIGETVMLVTAPCEREMELLRRRLRCSRALAERTAIATPETIRSFIAAIRHPAILHYAVNRLSSALPSLSAASLGRRGASGAVTLLAALLAVTLVAPVMALTAAGLLSTLFFINCSAWKLGAAFRRPRPLRIEALADHRLPTYAALIPLYREAGVVPDLVSHLSRLDYPRTRLQVILIVEADDAETRAAVDLHVTEPHFEVIAVPPGGPRTKPRALSYALSFVRSEYVVVFDAEDRPEPDQLRKAAAAFRERPELGCVQARLAPDNDDSWLARMFAVEYAANFEVLLPALASWGAPVPLGGTSNHFPRSVLEEVGAWDPFNVTEDADLGIRLARFGYPTATILSRTHEEAPVTFRQWLPQRRRWIKGWIQTVLLTLRRGIPDRLKLPLRSRLAVHGVLTAGVLGLLLYPASLFVIGAAIVAAFNGNWPATALTQMLLVLNLANLIAILVAALISALRGLAACRLWRRIPLIVLLPLYWALMSLAAWQALFQVFRRPSMWEKTTHGVSRARRASAPSPSAF